VCRAVAPGFETIRRRGHIAAKRTSHPAIDPVENLVGERGGEIEPGVAWQLSSSAIRKSSSKSAASSGLSAGSTGAGF
jgi:hypothetical protein